MYFKISYPVKLHYTRRPRRCRVPMPFLKLQVAIKRKWKRSCSCRWVLSAVGINMISLKRYSVEMSYTFDQRSHVVTPHKLCIDKREINLPCEESILLFWKETETVCPSLYCQITCVAGLSCVNLELPYAGDFELFTYQEKRNKFKSNSYLLMCWSNHTSDENNNLLIQGEKSKIANHCTHAKFQSSP